GQGPDPGAGGAVAPIVALHDLSRARRRNRAAGVDVFEGFYQAYLTAFGCAVAVLLGSDAIGDQKASAAQVTRVLAHGPEVIGAVIAVILAVAVRSGSRGGPLVLPAADVRHVLLAPVPRRDALRGPAVRQVRFSAFVGLVVGAGLWVLAARRLPGGLPEWVLVGGGVGAVTGAMAAGVGLLASGRRVRPWLGGLLAIAVLAWSGLDLLLDRVTSPMAVLGRLALAPIEFSPATLAVLVVPVAAAVFGIAVIGGLSLEQAERRATLASQIRFALTLQDLRTVVLLRRQLTQEQSRARPWVRLRGLAAGRSVVWRRDLRGLTRWPAVRIGRVVLLGLAAGLALVGTWAGTTPLLLVAALALFLAGLEALEPLAQDIDHPDIPAGLPLIRGDLRLRHAAVPFGVMVAVVLIGWGAAVVVALAGVFPVYLAVQVGAALVLPAALLGTVGAAASVVMEPALGGGDFLPAEIAGVKLVLRAIWSPALVLLGLTPLLVARSALHRGASPGQAALSGAIFPVMVGVLGLGWLRFREDVHEYFRMSGPAAKAAPGDG
ncbi:MAG: hypothetical protein ACHQNA_07055, partial [Acidimicrobiales bacterium]